MPCIYPVHVGCNCENGCNVVPGCVVYEKLFLFFVFFFFQAEDGIRDVRT